jgi:prepilin-type N-terminal cleavage/methylation domain-containing protein
MKLKTPQNGFTIIELMIATMIFSGILLGATTALLQINKLYFGGVTTTKTQQVTRQVINDISQQIQFTNNTPIMIPITQQSPTPGPSRLDVQTLCIGNVRYSYVLNAEVDDNAQPGVWKVAAANGDNHLRHALWKDTVATAGPGTCTSTDVDLTQAVPSPEGQELLGQNMRLSRLTASCNAATYYCSADIQIIFGENDLISFAPDGTATGCQSIVGAQWCAVSELGTNVYRRVHSGS